MKLWIGQSISESEPALEPGLANVLQGPLPAMEESSA
jgi:hypothetical protein